MKTTKRFYYQFWLQSSRGTNDVIMRRYDTEPTKEQLKQDVEDWCERHGAWHVSENHLSYGWKPVVPPRSRKIALARYQAACKLKSKWNEKVRLYAGFLQYL